MAMHDKLFPVRPAHLMGNTEDMQELMDYNSLQDKKTYYNCQLSNDDRRGDYQCCIAPPRTLGHVQLYFGLLSKETPPQVHPKVTQLQGFSFRRLKT